MKGKIKKIPLRLIQNQNTKKRNKLEILTAIENNECSLSELVKITELSRPAILEHLDEMQKEKLIEKKFPKTKQKGKRIVYAILDKGRKTINVERGYQMLLEGLIKNGRIIFGYSELGMTLTRCSLPWGIDPYLIMEKNLEKLKLLEYNDVEEIEKLLYRKIASKIKYIQERRTKFREESLESLKKDKFVLGFIIDLPQVHKSINKNSLDEIENMSDEEISSHFKSANKVADYIGYVDKDNNVIF